MWSRGLYRTLCAVALLGAAVMPAAGQPAAPRAGPKPEASISMMMGGRLLSMASPNITNLGRAVPSPRRPNPLPRCAIMAAPSQPRPAQATRGRQDLPAT